jgi:guanylate kinase
MPEIGPDVCPQYVHEVAACGVEVPHDTLTWLEQNAVVISAITCAGKNTVVDALTGSPDAEYGVVVSAANRKPRPDEIHGQTYWFIGNLGVARLLQSEEFIEYQEVQPDQFRGITKPAVEAVVNSGKKPLIEMDVQGAQTLLNQAPRLRVYTILPNSFEEWLRWRGLRNDGIDLDSEEGVRRSYAALRELNSFANDPRILRIINQDVAEVVTKIAEGWQPSVHEQHAAGDHARNLAKDLRAWLAVNDTRQQPTLVK